MLLIQLLIYKYYNTFFNKIKNINTTPTIFTNIIKKNSINTKLTKFIKSKSKKSVLVKIIEKVEEDFTNKSKIFQKTPNIIFVKRKVINYYNIRLISAKRRLTIINIV